MKKKHVLVVDDEPTILMSMQRMLERDYDVTTADSGKTAIDLIDQGAAQFDVIICDLSMPDVNGANLYLYVLKKYPGVEKKIIFMTGGPFAEYIDEFFISHSNPCLSKPFETQELRQTIEAFLQR